MLVDRLEPAMDTLVLIFVEVLQLLGFVSGVVESDGTIAVSFPGCIGADEVHLAAGLQLGRELVWVVFAGVVWRLIFDIEGDGTHGGGDVPRRWELHILSGGRCCCCFV